MQATTVQTGSPGTAAPVAPATAPDPNIATVVINNADGTRTTLPIPMNRAEVQAIRSARSELSNQLTSAADRRHELAMELRSSAPGADRSGLEQRIIVLDKRMVQLESDMAATGRQISATPLDVRSSADVSDPGDIPENVAALGGAVIGLILFPLTVVLARNLWKRGTRRTAAPQQQLAGDAGQRLERLEQGMDAIAIEIERVAEGQRFVTRILSEGPAGQSVSINRSMERSSTS